MSTVARALRVDGDTWHWLEWRASWWGSMSIVLGTFLMLAYNRFGWPDFAPRETVRFLLAGFYGWLWLAGFAWLVVRVRNGFRGSFGTLARLVGHAHLPLLILALVMQLLANLSITNVAGWVAGFVGAFWMPAMLANATAAWAEIDLTRAIPIVALPYLAWAATVGRYLWDQLEHLL